MPSDSPATNLFNLVGILPRISLKDIFFISIGVALIRKEEILYDLLGDDVNISIDLLFFIKLILFFLIQSISLISARGKVATTEVPFSNDIGKSFHE